MKRSAMWSGLAAAALLLYLGCVAAYGSRVYTATVRNRIETGDVSIDLTEYQIGEDGQETLYQRSGPVQPAEIVSKIPRITNLSMPCYVRAKLLSGVIGEEEGTDLIPEDHYLGISGEWQKSGEYYYYRPVLESGDSVDLFQALQIPESWTGEQAGQSFQVKVVAEAIQAANFQPDYESEQPWGEEVAEECVHEADNSLLAVAHAYQGMSVTLDGAADELLAVPGDFFGNLGTSMPGDVLSDEIHLENTTDQTAELLFSTHIPEDLSDEERALLSEYALEIRLDDQLLYEGNLGSEALENPVSLGSFAPGSEERFDFSLTLPKEEKNRIAREDTEVDWIFTTRLEEGRQVTAPKTGVEDSAAFYAAAAAASFVLCMFAARRWIRRNPE